MLIFEQIFGGRFMMTLNINIDHVATIRNARGGVEPDPVTAAMIAEISGCHGIVAHLREDRRHINDRDVRLLKDVVRTKFDLEMAAHADIIKLAHEIKPELVTIVPEKREELTTEGGLNLKSEIARFKALTEGMHDNGIEVSFFIEPDNDQIDAALECRADMVELHTGVYADKNKNHKEEIEKIEKAAKYAAGHGLKIAAGHGLNYTNVHAIAKISTINELSIGHSIISRAVFIGLERAVKEMLDAMQYAQITGK